MQNADLITADGRQMPAQELPGTGGGGAAKNLSPVVDGKEYCPQCGRMLEGHRCKLVCACGYFMSCAEF